MSTGSHPTKIHEFYKKLLFNVQSLETLGKLTEISGYVRMSVDKLQGIRGDLVRTDDNWRKWGFPKFVEVLRKWTERNPIPAGEAAWPEKATFTARQIISSTAEGRTSLRLCLLWETWPQISSLKNSHISWWAQASAKQQTPLLQLHWDQT